MHMPLLESQHDHLSSSNMLFRGHWIAANAEKCLDRQSDNLRLDSAGYGGNTPGTADAAFCPALPWLPYPCVPANHKITQYLLQISTRDNARSSTEKADNTGNDTRASLHMAKQTRAAG